MPRKRYHHRWLPAAGDSYPTRYICVDCDVNMVENTGAPSPSAERLRGWSCHSVRASRGAALRTTRRSGGTARQFFDLLRTEMKSGTVVWVFVDRACRFLSLVGFWEMLENGTAKIAGTDSRNPNESAHGVSEVRGEGPANDTTGRPGLAHAVPGVPGVEAVRDGLHPDVAVEDSDTTNGGCCVLEDPPTIVVFTIGGAKGTAKIVDLRNYGPENCWGGGGAADRVERQAGFVAGAIGILRDNGLGTLKCTAGSQSVYSLRRKHLSELLYCHCFGSALRLERDSYHGGRCECYRLGEIPGPVYHLDVKSLYPSLCTLHDLPTLVEEDHDPADFDSACVVSTSSLCIGDITLTTGEPAYPCTVAFVRGGTPYPVKLWESPFVGAPRGQVVYPTGTFRTALCGPELADAVRHGHVVAFHKLTSYAGSKALKPFMEYWYGLLRTLPPGSKDTLGVWIKRVMVSLIGKLGETGKQWRPCEPDPQAGPYNAWSQLDLFGGATRHRQIAWRGYREHLEAESSESIPAIASYVTSLGRMRLLNLVRTAGWGNVYYVDTDAIICGPDGYDRLRVQGEIRESELGYLRLLGRHDYCRIYGVKHYQLDDKTKWAGVPRGHVGREQGSPFAEMERALPDKLRRRERPEAEFETVNTARQHRYRHGRVLPDGTVLPWHFGD